MIIECPSCKTRFSVDEEQVSRIENPRFHCSRCDHYFHQAKQDSPTTETVEKQSIKVETPNTTTATQLNFETLDESKPKIKRNTFIDDDEFEEEDENTFFANWPEEDNNETKITTKEDIFIKTDLFEPKNPKATTDTSRIPTFSSISNNPPATPPPTTVTHYNEQKKESSFKIHTEDESLTSDFEEEKKRILSTLTKNNSDVKKNKLSLSSIYSCLTFLSIPLITFVAIFSWSKNIDLTPQSLNEILGIDSTNFPHPPPLGLDVIDLQSNFISLDNQEKALEIRGQVYNSTSKTYEDVMLDSRLFTEDNKLLDRLIVNSNNKITNAKIEAMNPETILEMQKTSPSINLKISPNDKIPFRVIFFPYNLKEKQSEKVRWFSTRVYSTKLANS